MSYINKIKFELSEKPNKKLKAYYKGKWIHFGSKKYDNYFDRTGLLNGEYDHLDDERRRRYLARATKIKDKEGNLTYKDKSSPNFYSVNFLW
jgi:hypothetical protein